MDVVDLRNRAAFPDLPYRFSTVRELTIQEAVRETRTVQEGPPQEPTQETSQQVGQVILERDFLGENPLHYLIDTPPCHTGQFSGQLIVASNILDIKQYLHRQRRPFAWERIRAVSNNTRVTIDDDSFCSASPTEEELGPTLSEYELDAANVPKNYADMLSVGPIVRRLLQQSIERRLGHIDRGETVGLLLSGGLDSMSVGYLLAQYATQQGRKIVAFTLKTADDDLDIVKSRQFAEQLKIDLIEVYASLFRYTETIAHINAVSEQYTPDHRRLVKSRKSHPNLDAIISNALDISGNPKQDNVLCAVAMHLIAPAISAEGITAVFCGEGPNEMINDYGFNPRALGYPTKDKGDITFREALTFGLKKTDRQLGRGGLAKHATARMGKIFAHHNLRLEAPYFDRDIARVMTRIPHIPSYDRVKQHLVQAMFTGCGIDQFIEGTSKEKFQDGSGISKIFARYDQRWLIDAFERLYGVRKVNYLEGKSSII
ncbi:hypothetical protein HYS47_02935 [Candidatus Woesearchaeota archaeon]|nr:hypothetical protein [Candidatus Woesearchaeota archaeon]